MILGKVIGTCVCTQKDQRLKGVKFQIVFPLDIKTLKTHGDPLVAIDSVGAGVGELVMVVSGSSARQTEQTTNTPVDATIIAIIDIVEVDGNIIFRKSEN